ncbi:hypothetical protein FANTH_11169 [Fusarium anthophilum]|uniref:Uncharacterized protein n=1 Tax=Fusarium anthophilum TaxID=48485 RepID=A0A8H4YYR1_9HYPO|nr:hypothetical protein FANTH_11169 [Fusarium anthophilum]
MAQVSKSTKSAQPSENVTDLQEWWSPIPTQNGFSDPYFQHNVHFEVAKNKRARPALASDEVVLGYKFKGSATELHDPPFELSSVPIAGASWDITNRSCTRTLADRQKCVDGVFRGSRISFEEFYHRHPAVGDQVMEEDEGLGFDDVERLRAQAAKCQSSCKMPDGLSLLKMKGRNDERVFVTWDMYEQRLGLASNYATDDAFIFPISQLLERCALAMYSPSDSHRIHTSITRASRQADDGFNIPKALSLCLRPSTRRFNLQLGQGPIPKAARTQAKNSA